MFTNHLAHDKINELNIKQFIVQFVLLYLLTLLVPTIIILMVSRAVTASNTRLSPFWLSISFIPICSIRIKLGRLG